MTSSPIRYSSMADDAWDEAEQLTFAFAKSAVGSGNGGSRNARALKDLADAPRSKNPRQLHVYVEDLTAAKNMMRKAGLAFLQRLEDDIIKLEAWKDHCLIETRNTSSTSDPISGCAFPKSVVAPALEAEKDQEKDYDLSDAQVHYLVSSAHTSGGSCVTNTFTDTNVSSVVRSTWSFGLPIKGYDSAVEDEQKQERYVDRTVIRDGIAKQVEALVNGKFADEACSVSCTAGVHEFRVYFDYSGLGSGWATRQLSADGPLAGASMAFVWMVMSLHTRSLSIASVGMLQILLSFPVTYFFYRVVLQISHFGTLQVLAVYVILGIGADDIFVLYDAFQQAPRRHGPAARLEWALKRAVSAMTTTSFTTGAAFVMSALSPITNIKVFGIFASLLVLVNFLLCCLLTPILITLVSSGECARRCCCCCPRELRCGEVNDDFAGAGEDGMGDVGVGEKLEAITKADAKVANVDMTDDDLDILGWKKATPSGGTTNSGAVMPLQIERTQQHVTPDMKNLRVIERWFHLTAAPFVIRFRWAIVFLGAALLGTFGYFAGQLVPSDQGIGDIWPDDHVVARVTKFKSGPFLKGEARYMRVEVVFGLADNATTPADKPHQRAGIDRTGTSVLDPTIKGQVVWNPEFDFAAPASQSAFLSLCKAFNTTDTRAWVHDIDCIMQDLIDYRAYFGQEEFPIAPASAFWGNLSAMLGATSPLWDSQGQAAATVAGARIAAAAQRRATDAVMAGTPLSAEQVEQEEIDNQAELVRVLSMGPRNVALSTVRMDRDLSKSARGSGSSEDIKIARLLLVMPHDWDAVVSIKDFERRKINEVLDQEWKKNGKVSTLGRGTQTSGSHVWMDTQLSLVSSSLIGLAVSFVLSFSVLVVATRSFVASLISILAIVGIVAVVLGSMVLGGRNLGFMESICVTVVVGLAVDYVVHYGIAFVEHFREFEEGKEGNAVFAAVTGALTDLGVSVLGGATSTFGAALFLLFCVIK